MSPETIDKIFDAFEQGQSDITRRFGGLGLGLTISKTLIDAHGGHIRVQSSGKNQGAIFTVELKTVESPIERDGHGEDRPADRKPDAAVASHRRVLLVDDHHDTCLGMKRMLERRGYQITVANSAEQAVEKVRTQEFDLLISDIGLPDRSGYDLMREVRLNKCLPGIALSGFGSEQDVNQAREAGFAEHLTKPINFERSGENDPELALLTDEAAYRICNLASDPAYSPACVPTSALTFRSSASFNWRESFSTRCRMILPALNFTVARGGMTKLLPG